MVQNRFFFRFRLKYHPDDSVKQKELHKANVAKRFEVFQELQSKGWIDKARLDYNNGRHLIKLMDARMSISLFEIYLSDFSCC